MTAERMVAADSRRRAAGRTTVGGVVWAGRRSSYVGVAVSSRAAPFAAGLWTSGGLRGVWRRG
jgi:hypothetical protein